jgi:hypothetical protein
MQSTDLPLIDYTLSHDDEHDDYMSADDYDCREYYRNGWDEERYSRQRF